jgi:hypothetical protein
MELDLRTKAGTDAWTAIVPWARGWRRPTPVRWQRPPAERISWTSFPMDGALDRPTQEAWVAALSAQSAAREQLAGAGDLDSWPGVMAQHAVHVSVARLRLLARQLELVEGYLAGRRAPPEAAERQRGTVKLTAVL